MMGSDEHERMREMVTIACSPPIAAKIRRELAALGVALSDSEQDGSAEGSTRWALVERGFEVPTGMLAIVFDGVDYLEAVRTVAASLPGQPSTTGRLTGHSLDAASGGAIAVFSPREVLFLEASADAIVAVTQRGGFRVRGTLAQYETAWATRGFQRVNKSQIVNLMHVREIVPWFNSRYVLRLAGNRELEVSKVYAKRLRRALSL